MGQLIYVLGRSGTGKSYSVKNMKNTAIINIQGKILPFKSNITTVNTDSPTEVVKQLKELSKKYKSIVIDDFQYLMANEFMRRSNERGYDKFTEIARHAWDVADEVRRLPNDTLVYILCHTDTDQDGVEKLKTIGKLLDEKIVLEGMSSIVLKTSVSDGEYCFLTQNNGHDTVKSPAGMFDSLAIRNDLQYVDDKIRSFYELGDFKPEEEIEDASVELPSKKSRKRKAEAKVVEANTTEDGEPIEFKDAEMPEIPKRKSRRAETPEDPETETEDKAPRRRRRRSQ